jgi:hypothetical protein
LLLLDFDPSGARRRRWRIEDRVAKVDITPTDLTGLTSQWGMPLVGVYDPIFVRALVLDNGTDTAAIVSADLIEFGDTTKLRERIAREVGIPAGHLIIAATHDHSAPKPNFAVVAPPGATGAQAFTLNVYEKLVDALKQAKASLQPARMWTGRGTADVNINRNEYGSQGWHLGVNPDRQSDNTVWVVKFETTSGAPIAVLFNYAVHSVVAGPATDQLTGDLAGAAERYVEQHYKNKVVALFTIGAAADPESDLHRAGRAAGGGCAGIPGHRCAGAHAGSRNSKDSQPMSTR